MKVADVDPAATVTLAGTVAALVLLLESPTATPPVMAVPVKATVPVEVAPETTVEGLNVTDEGTAARTERTAVLVTLLKSAEIVDDALAPTGMLVTVNVAVVAPAATVTDAGTVAAAVFELVRVTADPPVGAGPFRVTVPAEDTPPTTVAGTSATEEGAGALTVSVAVFGTVK